jgi:hypothetical protein
MYRINMLYYISISQFLREIMARGDILEINQSETRIACGGHVC